MSNMMIRNPGQPPEKMIGRIPLGEAGSAPPGLWPQTMRGSSKIAVVDKANRNRVGLLFPGTTLRLTR